MINPIFVKLLHNHKSVITDFTMHTILQKKKPNFLREILPCCCVSVPKRRKDDNQGKAAASNYDNFVSAVNNKGTDLQ